jgi:hypothetical protein
MNKAITEQVHVAHLEGLTAIGYVEKYWTEECNYPGAKRIHAITKEGKHLITKCIDERGLKKVILYLAEAKRLSPLLVIDHANSGDDKRDTI